MATPILSVSTVKKHLIVPELPWPTQRATAGPAGEGPHPLQGAEFVAGAAESNQLPDMGAPEIAFAGRSNAGKSSAINVLANRQRLAFASRTPGRTQQINFFRLRSGALVADLPGYGYAAVARAVTQSWQDFLWTYVRTRSTLVALVVLMDARHGIRPLDETLLASFLPSGRPVLVLATKIDKVARQQQAAAVARIRSRVSDLFSPQMNQVTVVGFSATRRNGIEAAEAVIDRWLH